MFSLAEELLLLVMDEDNGEATSIPARTLGYALAGAVHCWNWPCKTGLIPASRLWK